MAWGHGAGTGTRHGDMEPGQGPGAGPWRGDTELGQGHGAGTWSRAETELRSPGGKLAAHKSRDGAEMKQPATTFSLETSQWMENAGLQARKGDWFMGPLPKKGGTSPLNKQG